MAATNSVNFTSSRRSVGIGGGRQAGPLDVEPPGHVEPPAPARLAQHGRAEGPIEGVAGGERFAARPPRRRARRAARSAAAATDSRIRPWLGRKSPVMASRWSQCSTRGAGRADEGRGRAARGEGRRGSSSSFSTPLLVFSASFDVFACLFLRLDRHDRRRIGPRHARQQHAHQPHEKLLIAGGPGNHVGQPAEHLDAVVGIAELDLLEVLRAERLLLQRAGRVDAHVHLLIGQREGGLPDDEVLAGRQRDSDRPRCRGGTADCGPRAAARPPSWLPFHSSRAWRRETCWSHGTAQAPPSRPSTIASPSGSVRRQRC